VASLNRPGGNLTGVTTLNVEVGPKRLELLYELIPAAKLIGVLVNPTNPANTETTCGMCEQRRTVSACRPKSFTPAARAICGRLRDSRSGTGRGPRDRHRRLLISRSEQLAVLALQHRVPTIFQYREFVAAGGLMS
jgi:putative ABC transport system substrate-binding protein